MDKEEIFSVNSDFSEFDLQQLEDRLETDPLAVGGLLDLLNEETPVPTTIGKTFCDWLQIKMRI